MKEKTRKVFSERHFAALPHLYVFVVSCLGLKVESVGKRKGDVWLCLSDGSGPPLACTVHLKEKSAVVCSGTSPRLTEALGLNLL